MSTKKHNWVRESSRRSRCSDCDLLAVSRTSAVTREPYTEWSLGRMSWESRTNATPNCPPINA